MRASFNRVEGLSFCDVEHLHGLSKAIWYHTQQLHSIKLFIMPITIHYHYHFHRVEGLCCLILPGLSYDIQFHVWPYFPKLAIMVSDIRLHTKWYVSLVIAWFFRLCNCLRVLVCNAVLLAFDT